MSKLNIKSLAVSTKKVSFDFPGVDGFKVTLCYLSRTAQRKLQESCKVTKVEETSGLPYDDLDLEVYKKEYTKRTIVSWEGLTLEGLSKLVLLDLDSVEDTSVEVPFDNDTAAFLVEESSKFDHWVSSKLALLDNFRN